MGNKISVIMSTYNETEEELNQSVNSILHQTFSDFEFIIVNDNPSNEMLERYLASIQDSRVIILKNETNLGLVKSLNRALSRATGQIIVRADADDISVENRIKTQLAKLEAEGLDLIGSYIELIDETGVRFGSAMKFPLRHRSINCFLKWGSCIPHPTWMGRRQVFETLQGYREVPSCEDYDFLLRAVNSGFRLGNVPEALVRYRIRENSISSSTAARQYILREFLSHNRKRLPSQAQIQSFLLTDMCRRNCELYTDFKDAKRDFRNGNRIKLLPMLANRYCWILLWEKLTVKLREHVL